MADSRDDVSTAGPDDASEGSPGQLQHGELFYMMHELSRLISTYFDQAMSEHKLTHAQWWGMMHVSENEGVTQTELATIMQMGRASAGKLLERLEAKGWIERRPDATDSRVRRVYLSGGIPPILEVMTIEGENLFRDFLTGISLGEEEAMLVGMRKMKANAERRLGVDSGEG